MASQGWLKFALRRALPALAVLALLLASLKLAEDAAGGGGAAQYYRWILAAAAVSLALLAVAIAQRLWRLRIELERGAPGARLGRRLLLMLVLLAVPPVVVIYGFALRFLDATIDNWFNVKLEAALDDALEIGRIVVDERLRTAEQQSVSLATKLADTPADELQRALDEGIDELGATQLTVFGGDGRVVATTSSDPRYLDPLRPDATMQMRVQGDGRYAAAEPIGDTLMLRVAVPVAGDVPASRRLLQGLYPLPTRLQALTRGIENASFDFQRLKFLRGSLKLTFALILTFALLLSVLMVTLAAFGVARRLVAPVGRLIAATEPNDLRRRAE